MANTTDFIVKNGLQISSNLVVGSYALNSNITQIANGAIISGNVGIGTSTVAPGNTVAISGVAFHAGNIRIGNASTIGGILFSDGTFQNTAPSGTVNSGTAGQLTYYAGTGTAVSGNANATISAGGLTLGVAGTAAGSLSLAGATSGGVQIQTAAAAGSWAMTLPTGVGTAGYFLQTDGTSGVTTWAAAAVLAPAFQTGRYYATPGLINSGGGANAGSYVYPFLVPAAATVTSLSVRFGAAVLGTSLQMAIYTNNGGVPGTKIGGSSVITTSSANVNSTVTASGLSIALPAGIVWVVVGFGFASNNCNVYSAPSGGGIYGFNTIGFFVGASTLAAATGAGGPYPVVSYTVTDVASTTYPSTLSGLAVSNTNTPPVVYLGV